MESWGIEYGDNYQVVTYSAGPARVPKPLTAGSTLGVGSYLESTINAARNTFLPVGYPQSVRPEYLEYQTWDTVQALSSYLRGIFTTRALLAGVGVGNANASALAAAVT
jgi:hypothetical protein